METDEKGQLLLVRMTELLCLVTKADVKKEWNLHEYNSEFSLTHSLCASNRILCMRETGRRRQQDWVGCYWLEANSCLSKQLKLNKFPEKVKVQSGKWRTRTET